MLKLGDKFSALDELESRLQEHLSSTDTNSWKRDCRTIESQSPETVPADCNKSLQYYSIKLSCAQKSSGNCTAGVAVKLSECGGYLVVTELNEKHEHPTAAMDEGANNFVSLKELSSTESDFTETMETLKEQHKCDVNILCDEDENILCLSFQDPEMKAVFDAYPETVFVGGTYCLNKNGPCVYTVLGEDSEGNGVVFAVGVLLNETEEVLDWFVNQFKEYNGNHREIKVVYTDRDAPINPVLVKHFPEASLEIALFNTINKFNSEISKNSNEHETARIFDLFKDVVLSSTEEVFEDACEKFLSESPEHVIEYYEKTWHPIKDLWVLYLTSNYRFSVNGNSNRLEVLNRTIKSIVLNFTNFEDFIRHFIDTVKKVRMDCLSEYDTKTTAQAIPELKQYKTNLTNYAFHNVQKQYVQSKSLNSFQAVDKGKMLISDSEGSFEVTATTCSCLFRITLNLPCGHVFRFRKIHKLPVYSEDLFAIRWLRKYYQSHHSFFTLYEKPEEPASECSDGDDETNINDEKFKLMYDECVKLTDICADLPDALFKKRVDFLNALVKKWTNFEDDDDDHEIFQDEGGDASPGEFLLEVAEDEEEEFDEDDEEDDGDSDSDYEINGGNAKRKKIG